MPVFLNKRELQKRELMDDPDCDFKTLINTYRQFSVINALISQWKFIYKYHILPYARDHNNSCSLLDIGFGGGDIPIKLHQWAIQDGIQMKIIAIETDKRAFDFAQKLDSPPSVTFNFSSSTNLVTQNQRFDFVISNHLLHHLTGNQFFDLLNEAKRLSTHGVLFNDIERTDIGYIIFSILSKLIFRSSFIRKDGLTSIKRSYTYPELKEKIPAGWTVERIFPYRLLLSYFHA